jgi:hypothetical protein
MDGLFNIAFVLGIALLYVLPSVIGRGKCNASAICCLNLALGWTLIGWVAAMLWSLLSPRQLAAARGWQSRGRRRTAEFRAISFHGPARKVSRDIRRFIRNP